ncbi:MAG: hypothetical protein R3B69_03725 [Candidatus Paceibacterota bacterium]
MPYHEQSLYHSSFSLTIACAVGVVFGVRDADIGHGAMGVFGLGFH